MYELAMHWGPAVVGLVLAGIALHTAWQCSRAGAWPTVPGEIVHSDIEDQVTENRDGGDDTRYKPWVRYRYAVKGRQFVGHRVSYGFEWHWFEWTARIVASRFPAGKRVRVHVSPDDPAESALEGGVTLAAAGLFVAGIALIATAFWR